MFILLDIHNGIKHNRIGYCHNKIHQGYLTSTSLKEHKCLEKRCTFLQKFDCPYWENYFNKLVYKQVRRYYYEHQSSILIDYDEFCKRLKKFYGGYLKVPLKKEKIVIQDYIQYLRDNNLIKEGD